MADIPATAEVLIALMLNARDFAIARDQHWYRIPIDKGDKLLKRRWPPQWVAFLWGATFGDKANCIAYYARVTDIRQVSRRELFPSEHDNAKTPRRYYQLLLSPLEQLPRPIQGRAQRWYSVFIQTTWAKFASAETIDDLYDDSPLEDALWLALKQAGIPAERQYRLEANGRKYALDFAVFCERGKIDIETDGDAWHTGPNQVEADNQRNNDLASNGWIVLRFSGKQIREAMKSYCVPTVAQTVECWGGAVAFESLNVGEK